MSRTTLFATAAVVVLALAAGAWWFVFGAGNAEPTVDVEDVVAGGDATASEAPPTGDPDAADGASTTDDPGTPAPDATADDDGAGATTYGVDQDASRVTYTVDEELRGDDVVVVGTTSEVATEVTLDPADPSSLAFGPIVVNARTFATDQGNRDNAVRGRILQTDDPDNELITFTPTSVGELPEDLSQAFSVDVVGDLLISGTTTEVTFPVTATPEGDGYRLTGETVVSREEYGLTIPSVPFVGGVGDEVTLAADLLLAPTG